MEIVPGLKYSKNHEWIKVEEDVATMGITHYAQLQLGDIVYVGLPESDMELKEGESIGAIESVKTAADIYTPLSGKIVKINEKLDGEPEKINEDPYGSWIVKIKMDDPSQLDDLMDETDYAEFSESEE